MVSRTKDIKNETDNDEDDSTGWDRFNPMRDMYYNISENYYYNNEFGCPPRNLINSKAPVRLHITGIPKNVTEAGLHQVFSPCGTVLDVSIKSHRVEHDSSRYGFVTFSNLLDATKALSRLNRTPPLYLKLCFAVSTNDKLNQNMLQFSYHADFSTSEDNESGEDPEHIKEDIVYLPCTPNDLIKLEDVPCSQNDIEPYHLYNLLPPPSENTFQPYLPQDNDLAEVVNVIFKKIGRTSDSIDLESRKTYNDCMTQKKTVKKLGLGNILNNFICRCCDKVVSVNHIYCKNCESRFCGLTCFSNISEEHKQNCRNWAIEKSVKQPTSTYKNNFEDKFAEVCNLFEMFYEQFGSILVNVEIKTEIILQNIVWINERTFIASVFNAECQNMLAMMVEQESKDEYADQVEIGTLVCAYVSEFKSYSRGYVTDKTAEGLMTVFLTDCGSILVTDKVKSLPNATDKIVGCNVTGYVVQQDEDFDVSANELKFKKIKGMDLYRAVNSDTFESITVELKKYTPFREFFPLKCINVATKSQVVITAFYSCEAVFVRPSDEINLNMNILSDVHCWCFENVRSLMKRKQWSPMKNEIVGVKVKSNKYEEFWRAQVIGKTRRSPQAKVSSGRETDEKYAVCILDTGENMVVASSEMMSLPDKFKKVPCLCKKVMFRDKSIIFNALCVRQFQALLWKKEKFTVEFERLSETETLAELYNEMGNNLCNKLRELSELPWQSGEKIVNPIESFEELAKLDVLRLQPYYLEKYEKILLKMTNRVNETCAVMLVLQREQISYVQNILTPQINEYCTLLSCCQYNPAPGKLCLVYCRDSKCWYRARCEPINSKPQHCAVLLVDYGIFANIPITDIRPMHEAFTFFDTLSFTAIIPELEKTKLSEAELLKKYNSFEFIVADQRLIGHDKKNVYILYEAN